MVAIKLMSKIKRVRQRKREWDIIERFLAEVSVLPRIYFVHVNMQFDKISHFLLKQGIVMFRISICWFPSYDRKDNATDLMQAPSIAENFAGKISNPLTCIRIIARQRKSMRLSDLLSSSNF